MPGELRQGAVASLPARANGLENREFRESASWTSSRSGVWTSLALVVLITLLGFRLRPIIGEANIGILYILAVIFSALRWGRRVVIIGAVSSAVLFGVFFVPADRSYIVDELWYSITLIGLLAVGLVAGILTVIAKEETRAARRREAQTAALYDFTKSLAEASTLDQMLEAIARHIPGTFGRSIVILLPCTEGLSVRFRSAELRLDSGELAAAARAFEAGEETGCGTGVFAHAMIRFYPLKTYQGVVGVLGILEDGSKELLAPDQRQLLGTFLHQAAQAVTRANLAEQAWRSEMLQEKDKFQKALLNSISHNLRTPITSVLGVLNSLLEDEALFDAATREQLLVTAQDEAIKLNRLVQNLLDMSRLEGGTIGVKAEPCDAHDVIIAAIEQAVDRARRRRVSVVIQPDLPLVPMDQVLIVQVLVNLIDNALNYSTPDTAVEIEALTVDHELLIRVADQGSGIPEPDLERVFDKFFRGSPRQAPRGAGLGLSICKGFVDAHGGRIWAGRRLQGGTEVAFALPLDGKP